jgi:hypothetical protein
MSPQNIDPHSYLAQWLDLRRREAASRLSFLLYLPGAGGIGWLLTKLTGSDVPAMVVAFAWMAMFGFFNVQLVSFRCPRCWQPFFRTAGRSYLFTEECVHCGLPKYALTKTGVPKLTDFEYDP